MEGDRDMPKRPWDTCREVPVIEDEQTPWKMIKLLKFITLFVVAVIVFGLALCSKTSFLLLVTLSNEGTKTLPAEQKPVALLCIGCSLVASSVLLLLTSFWKACYKTSKQPRKTTIALVLFFEFLVSMGAAILTIAAMPHLDIVTNVTILNSVAVLSALLQVAAQCTSKQRNLFLLPSILAVLLILLGYVLFVAVHITKDVKMSISVGLAVSGSILVSFNWWENYLRPISKSTGSKFLKDLFEDMSKCRNMLHILSSILRIVVTAIVVGAYVPLAKLDWAVITSISHRETMIIVTIIGVQLISSTLCHWFALAACKMHALRRCFILPLYLASLAVMVLFITPVIVNYEDYRISMNLTAGVNFTDYCIVVNGTDQTLLNGVFQELVLDVTRTLCSLGLSTFADISLLTGAAASWWIGLLLATLHLWNMNVYRIQRTQDLFRRRLYEGAFIEQSLLLNTRFDIQTRGGRKKKSRESEMITLYLCATMWHETYDEMLNILISIFRLDKYRPKNETKFNDFTFEAHIYFDDAFKQVEGCQGRQVNEYAENLVKIITEVYGIFSNIDEKFFRKQQQLPDQKIIRTPYGGRLVVTMPHGNNIVVHFKDKERIRHKKRWSQVMYLYYLFGWKLMTKYYTRWQKKEDEEMLKAEIQKEKHNTYLLALDGDTDFQPAAVMLLIDRLKMYPRVGAACGRIHPTGSGPAVWFQKFEYAVSHWLQKTAEHVFGCVLCSPGCFSLFRAEALMDDNVMKRYSTKSMEASHYIQYDQGEDRWLCTLLLKQGWRVEYNAASDAYTNAPEDFKELYNQRRRWGPSTMANVVDLLGSSNVISKRNPSMSKPFMLYQMFALFSAVLAPATICLLVAGSLSFILDISSGFALVIATIPPAIYLALCFKLKSDTQITLAAMLSIFYAFLMLVVSLTIIGSMVESQTILTPSSIFVIAMAIIYVTTAIMHPQEINLVFFGFLYIICVPSAYLLLSIYSMVNMNNVSWGTRETKPATEAPAPAATRRLKTSQKAKNILQRFLSWFKCCKKPDLSSQDVEYGSSEETMIPEYTESELQPLNTIVDGPADPEQEQAPTVSEHDQSWVTQLQNLSTDMQLQEDSLDKDEEVFWNELQVKYLQPLPDDKERQKKIASDLKQLRNKINFAFFTVNAMWLVATFTLQTFNVLTIMIPKLDVNLQQTGEYIEIDPIGFMFILGFGLSVVVQYIAMFYHRVYTLIHYVAFLDTEPKEQKRSEQTEKSKQKDDSTSIIDSTYGSQEDTESFDDFSDDESVIL